MLAYTSKVKDSFLEAFKQAVEHFKRCGREMKAFRSDAETVPKDGEMGVFLREKGFVHELSTPEAHYQNFVQRYVQTINKFTFLRVTRRTRYPSSQTLELGIVPRHRLSPSRAEYEVSPDVAIRDDHRTQD